MSRENSDSETYRNESDRAPIHEPLKNRLRTAGWAIIVGFWLATVILFFMIDVRLLFPVHDAP